MASLKDLALKIVLRLQDDASQGINNARTSVQGFGHEIDRVKQLAIGLFSLAAIKNLISQVVTLSDRFANLSARIKLATTTQQEYNAAQSELFAIAQRSRTSLESVIGLYAKVQIGIRALGGSQQQAFDTTEAIARAFKISGATASESAGGIQQLTQAISSGVLRGEEFNSVMENGSRVAQALADGLDVPISKLRGMAEAGELTSARVVNALLSQKEKLAAEYAQLPVTVAGAWQKLENQLLKYVGNSQSASDATREIAKSIEFVTNNLNGLLTLAVRGGEVLLALFAAGKTKALIAYAEALFAARAATAEIAAAASAAATASAADAASKVTAARASLAAAQAQLADAAATQVAIQAARASVAAKLASVNAQIALTEATIASTASAQAGTAAHYAHTVAVRKLALAEQHRAAILTELATLGAQQARVSASAAAATAAQTAATERLAAAEAAVVAGAGAGAAKISLFAKAIGLVNVAMAGFVGWEVGKWARQFDWVQFVGANVAQMAAEFAAFGAFMTRPLSLDSWRAFKSELGDITLHFDEVRANIGKVTAESVDSAEKITAAEQAKSSAREAEAIKQVAAFKKVQDASKHLTEQLEADAKLQTQAIEQALAERLIAIDGSNQLDTQKDIARIQAKLQAAQLELSLQHAVSEDKIRLIDAEYAVELETSKNNAERLKDVETSKRQAKLAVYQGVAEFYTAEVDKLTQVYAQETAAFVQAKQSIEALSANHQQRLLDLERQGMTERQKAASEELEFTKTVSALRAELAKGDAASQTTINELMSRAKTLQNDITQAAINSAETQSKKSSAIYEAKKRENELYGLEKGLLEANARAHEENAKNVLASLESNKQKLTEAKDLITGITEQLAKDYTLTIGIDQGSLATAQSAIADLVKPETKVITIETVNAGSGADAVPAQATGGPAGQPTGKPWRFASGGWARMAGLLSGYGGGDKRRALLEDGEYVVRKEAVKKLGVDTLNAVNQGELPLQRSTGGSIGDILQEELKKQNLEKIKKLFNDAPAEAINRFFGWGYFDDSIDMRGITKGNALSASGVTREKLENKLRPLLAGMDAQVREQVNRLMQNLPNLYMLRGGLGMTSNAFADHPLDASIRDTVNKESLVFNALLKDLGNTDAKTNKPTFSLPAIPSLPSAQAQAATMAAPSKTVTVQFKAPDGSGGVSAAFNSEADVSKMLDMIKQTGMRVGA